MDGSPGFDGEISPSPFKIPDSTISQDTLLNLNESSHQQRVLAAGIIMVAWQ